MSAGKPTQGSSLSSIDDAFLDNILETSEEDLRAELSEEGLSSNEVVAGLRSLVASVMTECAQARLGKARSELSAFRGADHAVPADDLQRRRERLAAMRAGAPAAIGMMMAARKGEGLSESDHDGLLDDLADLDRLSGHQDEGEA